VGTGGTNCTVGSVCTVGTTVEIISTIVVDGVNDDEETTSSAVFVLLVGDFDNKYSASLVSVVVVFVSKSSVFGCFGFGTNELLMMVVVSQRASLFDLDAGDASTCDDIQSDMDANNNDNMKFFLVVLLRRFLNRFVCVDKTDFLLERRNGHYFR
jgi:hypothetical protein